MTADGLPSRCRVCCGSSFSEWGRCGGQVLYQCKTCDLVFFFPYPSQDELNAFYDDTYHQERRYDGGGGAGRLRMKMYELDIADLEATVSVGGRFLDVGCAEGVFLSMLSDRWEKVGIDVSKPAISRAKEKPGVTAFVGGIDDVEDSAFDVIHLRGVLEHFLEPLPLVVGAAQKLKRGGALVLSNTPNIGGLVPRLFRGRFKLVLPNEHVNYFSLKTMQKLAEASGLSIMHVTYPYWGTPYASPLKDLFAVPWNWLFGKSSPPFWGNIVTVYMQKVEEGTSL